MARLVLLMLLAAVAWAADRPPVYVILWFDTEDYIEPAADDAALRIATDLTALGVRGTFKMVAEKARTLERRGRRDVIRALARHDIGYHSENHSVPPTPAVYLNGLGYAEGAAEFERREGPGARDVARIFGVTPSCYGQPGSSWGPQSNLALRRMGIRVYVDEGSQVALGEQPFWYGGLLYVFHMGRFLLRPSLDPKARLEDTLQKFDGIAAELERRGGGLISTFYHPTEFVTTEFWDGVNYPRGSYRDPSQWKMPARRTAEDSERCYAILRGYVAHATKRPNVKFVTARELAQIYASPDPPRVEAGEIRRQWRNGISFLETPAGTLSAADALQVLLGIEPRFVEGPESRWESTVKTPRVPRTLFERARREAVDFIAKRHALPPRIWLASEFLSTADFAATLAGDDGRAEEVEIRRGALEFERHIATDARRAFGWAIHPEGFDPAPLLELGRLQAWTLKPARLR